MRVWMMTIKCILIADSTQLFVDCGYEEVDLSDVDWSLMKYGMSMFQCCGIKKINLGCPKLDSLYSMSVFMEEMGIKEMSVDGKVLCKEDEIEKWFERK